MISGIGFSEILMLAILVLVFFGSKELPYLIRNTAKLINRLKRYTTQIRREIDDVIGVVDITDDSTVSTLDKNIEKKKELRTSFKKLRNELTPDLRNEYSKKIQDILLNQEILKKTGSILIYLSIGSEVDTRGIVKELFKLGKKVIVPYCKNDFNELGIAAIDNLTDDIEKGKYGIDEPKELIRDNFFKSDIGLVIVPGISFDKFGGRIGYGKGYYDSFLQEFRGQVPIWGLAFSCQISEETIPTSYRDIPVDQIITENGLLIQKES